MKRLIIGIIKWGVSISLIIWLYSRIDFSEFRQIGSQLRYPFIILGFAGLMLNTLICAHKWNILLRHDGIRIPLRTLFTSYWIGSFFSLFLPSSIGGDSYRIVDVASRSRQGTRSFASVFADRLSGFLALSIVGLVGGFIGYRSMQDPTVIWAPLFFVAVFAGLLFLILDKTWVPRILRWTKLDRIPKVSEKFGLFAETFRKYASSWGLLALVFSYSFLFHFLCVTVIWMYSRFLGMDYPILWFFIFIPVISIVEALPISIYGIGVRDTAYVSFFAIVGMPAEHALMISLTHVVMNAVFASFGGVAFIFRKHQKQ